MISWYRGTDIFPSCPRIVAQVLMREPDALCFPQRERCSRVLLQGQRLVACSVTIRSISTQKKAITRRSFTKSPQARNAQTVSMLQLQLMFSEKMCDRISVSFTSTNSAHLSLVQKFLFRPFCDSGSVGIMTSRVARASLCVLLLVTVDATSLHRDADFVFNDVEQNDTISVTGKTSRLSRGSRRPPSHLVSFANLSAGE